MAISVVPIGIRFLYAESAYDSKTRIRLRLTAGRRNDAAQMAAPPYRNRISEVAILSAGNQHSSMSEWNATQYNHVSTCQKMLAEEELQRLKLAGQERVLDVGCGDGKVTAEIARRVPQGSVVGVDPSRNMIDFAAVHFPPDQISNLRFFVGDARCLEFREEFDLAVSFNALHWVPEQEAALRSILGALKPGGRATLRFVPRSDRALECVIETTRKTPRWSGCFAGFQAPFAHFPPEEYRAMASRAGFQVDHILVEDRAWDFGAEEAFIAFCQATFVEWLRRLPESEHTPFIGDVLARYRVGVSPAQANEFRFQQMEVALTRRAG